MTTSVLEATEPAGETTVHFVLYDDGAVGKIETEESGEPLLGQPGTLVTEGQYLARLAVIETETAGYTAALEAEERARSLADFTALTALGLPEETARRLSGHQEADGHG